MKHYARNVTLTVVFLAFLQAGSARPVAAQQVWLAGNDPVVTAMIHRQGQPDYMELFDRGSPWQVAAKHVAVFMVSTQFVDHATDAQLLDVIEGLRARHISLGMAGLMLVPSRRCGSGVESYGRRGVMDLVASRISHLGGTLDYVAFDEPVWFGHVLQAPRTCQDTLQALAMQMVEPVQALKRVFPKLSFVDTEPLNNHTELSLLSDILEFARLFRQATSYTIDAVHADVIWRDTWQHQYRTWYRALRQNGLRVGVICRGSQPDPTDEAWTAEAIETIGTITSGDEPRPDVIRIQTWGFRPTHMLPDNDPASLTSVVRRAFRY